MRSRGWTGLVLAALAAAVIIWILWPATRSETPPAAVDASSLTEASDSRLSGSVLSESRPIRPKVAAETHLTQPESLPGTTLGAVTVRVVWAEDWKAAPGVFLRVVEWGARTGVWKTRDVRTGTDGSIRVTDLVPGRVVFYVDRGGSQRVELAPRDEQEITIEIPPGMLLAGTVVDPNATPVPGADVWLSRYGNAHEGTVVEKTDAAGKFMLRAVGSGRWIAVRSRDYSQSEALRIPEGKPGETVTVQVQLRGPAGTVRGHVVRGDDSPVPGARVQMASPPISAETDQNGVFLIESLPAGMVFCSVRVPGLAPWRGSVEVRPAEVTPLKIQLQSEAVVVGTVRLANGELAVGAAVSAGASLGPFLFSSTTTSADGTFRLGSLMPGRIELTTWIDQLGKATATLECAEGAEVRWDAVLDSGLSIVGVVRDDQDRPLEGFIVNARPSPEQRSWLAQSVTDAEGRFRIVSCPKDSRVRLEVVDRRARPGFGVRAAVDNVVPSDTEVVIRISEKALGAIVGRVLGPYRNPAAAIIRLDPPRAANTITIETDPKTGAFSIGPLVPDRWRVIVERKPLGSLNLGDRELFAGDTLDLGDITLPAMGTLVIDLSASGMSPKHTTCELCQVLPPKDGRPGLWSGNLNSAYVDLPRPLEVGPGTYRLVLSSGGGTLEPDRFEVYSGRETRLVPTPRTSAPR
jgi:Carboxypeptidase regulatory-like domain